MTTGSSLQRAVQQSQQRGAFESSFASGLDLSEFGGSSSTTTHHKSAAAQLLELKRREAQVAARQEQEEVRLQSLARAKARQLQASCQQGEVAEPIRHAAPSQTAPNKNSATDVMEKANISATLVHLHGTDVNGAHHKAKKQLKKNRQRGSSLMRGKQSTPSRADKGRKKMSAVKRSKRSKY